MPLPLEHSWGHKTLDLGGLEPLLGLALLQGQGPLDHVLAHVIVLSQVEQLTDLGGTLGSEPAGDGVVGQAGNLSIALLHDGHGDDGQVAVNDATADRLALPLSLPAGTVAGVVLAHEQPDPLVGQDTLLHWEALLVVATSDTHHIALLLK